jgi:predicted AAA+ superfamily ATPase
MKSSNSNLVESSKWVDRLVNLPALLEQKSHFLLGPRQTGKTFLVRHTLKDARVYDLLDTSIYLALNQNPGRMAQELGPKDRIVVIDEIQRLPELLNEVHRLIETRRVRFLLTGSSARKLRRGGVNLLAGRARIKYLHPLSYRELGNRFDLRLVTERGLLPSIIFPMIRARSSKLCRLLSATGNRCRRSDTKRPRL